LRHFAGKAHPHKNKKQKETSMNHQRVVQLAVICLQELDEHAGQAVSFQEISQRRGIPLPECAHVIRQLSKAGIVDLADDDQAVLRRDIEELTALEILQAMWAPAIDSPAFQFVLGHRGAAQTTQSFIASAWASRATAING